MNYEETEKILKNIEKEELESFLLYEMSRDRNLYSRFKSNFSEYMEEKSYEELKEEIFNSFYRLSDRGYFSDYDGRLATGVVWNYSKEIKKYIERKEFNRSFNILKALLWALGKIQIDGSNGEHGDIQDELEELTDELVKICNEDEKKELQEWFKSYIPIKDEFYDYKDVFEKYI